jgi:hypothetical protein
MHGFESWLINHKRARIGRKGLLPCVALGMIAGLGCGDEGPAGVLFKVEAGLVRIETRLIPATTVAGSPVKVQCVGVYEDTREELLSLDLAPFSVHPSEAFSLQEDTLLTERAGIYSVACDVKGVTELVPAELTVKPDAAYRIRTEVDRYVVTAGENVNVGCIVEDQYGNPTTARYVAVRAQPSRGVVINDRVLLGQLAGDYAVECTALGLAREPESVTVVAADPTRAAAELSEYGVMAGTRVEVTCHLSDDFGNEVQADTNYTVASMVTSSDDQGFTAETSGQYWVTCHAPAFSVQSPAVLLTVYPNLPASIAILSLTPQLMIYARTDIVDVAVLVLDIFGNEITNADVIFRGNPTGSVSDLGFGQAMLLGDGPVELIAEVVSPTHNNQTVQDSVMILVDGSPPAVEFLFPARAEMVVGAPNRPLIVRGRVTDAISGLSSFTVNSDVVTPDANGNFQFTMNPKWGVNLIEGSALDNVGNEKAFAQSFQYSSEYRRVSPTRINSGRIYDGLIAHLGQEALDDSNADVDDLARIAELAIENIDINSLIPSPVTTYNSDCSFWPFTIRGALRLYVDNVTFNAPDVQLTAINGGVFARVEINNFRITIRTGGDVCDIPISLSGVATANRVVVSGNILISGNGNSVQVSMPSPNVSISGLNINLNLPGIISWAVNGIINLFSGQISNLISNSLEGVVSSEVPSVLRGFLESLNVATGFNLPPPVSVALNLDSNLGMVQFDTSGGNIGLDTSIYAQGTITPEPRGGIIQETQLIPTFSVNNSLGVAIAYDVINQVLYSLWYGGGLDIDAQDFLSGSAGQGSGIGLEANLSALGPPVLKPISGATNPVELQIGDLKLDLILNNIPNTPPINAIVYVTLFVDANVVINSAGEIELSVGQNVRMALEFDTDLDSFLDLGLLIGTLETAVQGLLPQIVSSALGGIPLPDFDLSSMAGNYLPPGVVLGLGNATTRFHSSYIILEGDLVQIP